MKQRTHILSVLVFIAVAASCENVVSGDTHVAADSVDDVSEGLSADERRTVAELIRGIAAAKGITNAVLLAGVAQQETNLVHCYADAPYHCAGPWSSSCGGAVLAGSGDGACSARQGGLGMFQLDSGSYAQTRAQHGDAVLDIAGNIDIGIDFIVHKVEMCPNTPLFSSRDDVIAWINGALPGTDAFATFHHAMAACYNGCSVAVCGTWLHNERVAQYEHATWTVLDEMGFDFWYPHPPMSPPPPAADPEQMTCGEYASSAGYADAACEWNGNGACGARGPATTDCEHCCDWAALPFSPPSTSEMSCGEYAEHVQFTNAQCEWNGNGACDGVGARTWDCDACCDRP